MAFPSLVPSSRTFDPGNFPVKVYQSQDGAEVRLLYGDKRVGMRLQLQYQNIPDSSADDFIAHFHAMKGTFTRFTVGSQVNGGFSGSSSLLSAVPYGSQWRYESAPQLQSVYPGVSTVSVSLIGAASSDDQTQ